MYEPSASCIPSDTATITLLVLSLIHICSQYEFEEWYDQLGGDDSPLADAIIDRIAHDSSRINITSIDAEHDISMREDVYKRQGLLYLIILFFKKSDIGKNPSTKYPKV